MAGLNFGESVPTLKERALKLAFEDKVTSLTVTFADAPVRDFSSEPFAP